MNIDVFISYHTKSCLSIVEAITNKFESHGVRCWYAPRNTTDGAYAQSITNAIANCRIFLLILNHESSESFDVKNEINLVCERLRRGEEVETLLFKIANDEFSADIMYYFGRMHWIDAVTPPIEKRIDELLERVQMHLGRSSSVELQKQSDTDTSDPDAPFYRITAARMYPNSRFVGRERELEQIHTILSGKRNKLFLVGMGGLGKSEIVKKYCEDYRENYDIIKWVTFSGTLQETIASDCLFDIEGLQRADHPDDSERDYYNRKMHLLRSTNRRVLLVVDNFDTDGDRDLYDFCSGEYSVIFTTRIRQKTDTIPQVEIHPMMEDELLMIFLDDAGRTQENTDIACVRDIIRYLQGHTYGVRIAASVMKKQRMKPQELLSLLQQNAGDITRRNIQKAESEILDRLGKLFDLSSLGEEAVYILKNLYFMPLAGVPVELFGEWCELDGYDEIDLLIAQNWIVHETASDTIHLHPLISELMAELVARDVTCCATMLKNMVRTSENGKYSTFEKRQIQLTCESSFFEKQPAGSPYKRKALFLLAERFNDVSSYGEGIDLCKKELYASDLDDMERAYLYFRISHMLIMSEHSDEALKIATEGWERVRDLPLDQISMKLGYYRWEIYTRLVEANYKLGNYDVSVCLAKEGLEEAGRFYIDTPEQIKGWARYHLASALYYRNKPGDNEEAMTVFEEAIKFFDLISNEWSKAFCYEVIARIQTRQGHYAEALANNMRAYEILYPLLGDSHLDIGDNLLWRGETFQTMGDLENARKCYEQALAVYRRKKLGVKETRALACLDAINEK